MKKILLLLKYSIFKSFIASKKAVGFKRAFKFPILVSRSTKIKLKGNIEIKCDKIFFGMIKIGEKPLAPILENKRTFLIMEKNSKVIFSAYNCFSQGCIIHCEENAKIVFGEKFWANVNCVIWTDSLIETGKNVLLGWNVYLRNFDGHKIYVNNEIINKSQPLYVSDHVWFCSNSSVIKGVKIDKNCVIGYGSLITKDLLGENNIFAGNPAKKIKDNVEWVLY